MAASEVKVCARWWLMPFIYTLVLFCWLFRTLPDVEKLEAIIVRGLYIKK